MRTFKQLTFRDRKMISVFRDQGLSLAEIARRIGKHRSTISRELWRNASSISSVDDRVFWTGVSNLWGREESRAYGKYLERFQNPTDLANWSYTKANRMRKLRVQVANGVRAKKSKKTIQWVIQCLREGWSPQQIAGRSKIAGPEPVSHEYVYLLVKRDKGTGGTLYRSLRRHRKRKQRFGARNYDKPWLKGILNRVSIEKRPKLVNKRKRLGDLEADLIQGHKTSGYVLSVVDRRSRYTVLRRIQTKDKTSVRLQLEQALKQYGIAHTLTVDNGREFSDHETLRRYTGVPVYFCHPYCSTERGSIENLNGLVRQYLPKRKRFLWLSQKRLDQIQTLLNERPRACLNFLTPLELQIKESSSTNKSARVAFDS